MWKRLIDRARSLTITPAYAEDGVVGKPAEQLMALPSSQYQSAHLENNTVPMKLCHLCSKLNLDLLSKDDEDFGNDLEHQPRFTALETSVSAGCEMCSMFLQCVTRMYCDEMNNCSPEEAHQVFRSVETHGKAPCLIRPIRSDSKIRQIEYWIPTAFKEGFMKVGTRYGDSACFILSNFPGFEDERIDRTELAPMPDFKIARRWIEQCTGNHQKCSTEHTSHQTAGSKDAIAKVPPLPTRVLDVGFNRGEEPCLLISGNRRAQYVALSHCWGKIRPLVTESSNLLQRLELIPLLSMPKTFQDAVITTRELGFQFLWIDSLCIIQDSSQDWERECSSMAQIYQNSAVTICGSAASDSCAGFLHTRSSPQPVPYHWMYRNSKGGELKRATLRLDVNKYGSATYPDDTMLTAEESISPLRHRGWTLQEYLLSPRLLFFGLYRMYWECNTHTQFEDFPTGQEFSDFGLHCSVPKATFMPFDLSNEPVQWKEWHSVVEEYSLHSITKPTDKLPALSGIAGWLLDGRGDIYLAGLLKHALHAGLTWHIHRASDRRPPISGYRGPSWSWVSIDYPVTFYALVSQRFVRSDEHPEARRRRFESTSQKTKMQVHDAQVNLRGRNLFGEVWSGSIKLRGRVKKGNVRCETEHTGWFGVCDSSVSEEWIGHFYPDNLDLWFPFARKMQDVRHLTYVIPSMPITDSGYASSFKAHAEERSDSFIPNQEVECLCIDVFRYGWFGLVIEPLPRDPFLPSRSGFSSEMEREAYKPYKRIGALEQLSNLHWFESGESKLIELF